MVDNLLNAGTECDTFRSNMEIRNVNPDANTKQAGALILAH